MKTMWMAVVVAAAVGAAGCGAAKQVPVVYVDAPAITVAAKRPVVVRYDAPAITVSAKSRLASAARVPGSARAL